METNKETVGHFISADGSKIGYRKIGSGPALVIAHGGNFASWHYRPLAKFLAGSFAVFTYDRRGRGLSTEQTGLYSLNKEIEDLHGMIEVAAAKFVFGHSLGAVFTLHGANSLPIARMALYEPPLLFDNYNPFMQTNWLADYQQAIQNHRYYRAMSLFVKGMRLNAMSNWPMWKLNLLFRLMMWGENKRQTFQLLPLLVREFGIFNELRPDQVAYRQIKIETLLLAGANTPEFLKKPLETLGQLIPQSHYLELEGMDHGSPIFAEPGLIGGKLIRFFLND